MKTKQLILMAGLMCISSVALSANSTEPNQTALTAALNKYLAQQGDFCLGKFDWPIDVSESDVEMKTRDAVQMPVLEKLGLVASSDESVMGKAGDAEVSVSVKRYTLTGAGKKFYLDKKISNTISGGKKIVHHGDFCAAKLSLKKLARWDKSEMSGEYRETTVYYTYKIAAAKWTHDPEIQEVFPMLARILKGEGTMQLQQRFRLTGESWVALHPDE
jgi:hypothetical protein